MHRIQDEMDSLRIKYSDTESQREKDRVFRRLKLLHKRHLKLMGKYYNAINKCTPV